jgi:phage gp16-like protein
MVRGLWLELHQAGVVKDPSERALNRWVKRMTGVDALRWLTPAQMNSVIEALKKWNDRPRSCEQVDRKIQEPRPGVPQGPPGAGLHRAA